MNNEERTRLLLSIARCPKMQDCLERPQERHHCSEIVGVQSKPLKSIQLPEPWSGQIEKAKVLFLSSNPSIGAHEEYPSWSWADEDIVDFFQNRFGGGRKVWIKDGLYPLRERDEYGPKKEWVRYWAAVGKRAGELWVDRVPQAGIDYALSEVVHCKSTAERGVQCAAEECVPRYLEELVAAANATVVVCMGSWSASAVRRQWGIPESSKVHGPVRVGERDRYFTFLPNRNARGHRSFSRCVGEDGLAALRPLL